jgi:hypothetical protein
MGSPMANALDTWTSFFTADEAAARIVGAMPSLSLTEANAIIHDLVEDDCLISQSQIIASAVDPSAAASGEGIAWLAIPTSDRVPAVECAVRSYAENIRHYGRQCGILISDDSRDARHRAASLEMLSTIPADPAIPVWHSGLQEKLAFAKHLAQKGDIPPEIIQFGLFGSPSPALKTGANRNAILLQTFGSMVLTVDDDTVCDIRLAPGTRSDLAVAGHFDPAEAWCFPERPAALSFGDPAELDIVGEHAKYLGRPVLEILSSECGRGNTGVLDQMCGHLLLSLASGRAQIHVTYNGARGDSGFHSDLGQVSSRLPATRRRAQDLGDDYRAWLGSRQIARQVVCPTISHVDSAAVAMFMGLDNRLPLPAFMPDCRNQDGVFANVLRRASDHYYSAHLPFTLAHEPPEARSYAVGRDSFIRVGDLIIYCLSTWRPEPGDDDPLQRMLAMGRHLRRLGSLPARDFDEIANVLMCSRVSATVEMLESVLVEDCYTPRHWAEDLDGRIEALRRLTDKPDFFVPVDLPGASRDPPARRAQHAVAQYGQLLEWWPAIAERAAELRNHGVTIARCLSGPRAMERALSRAGS